VDMTDAGGLAQVPQVGGDMEQVGPAADAGQEDPRTGGGTGPGR